MQYNFIRRSSATDFAEHLPDIIFPYFVLKDIRLQIEIFQLQNYNKIQNFPIFCLKKYQLRYFIFFR